MFPGMFLGVWDASKMIVLIIFQRQVSILSPDSAFWEPMGFHPNDRFWVISEASTTHWHTLVGFAFDSGMFSFGFPLRTSILYNFIEADCGFSFFWTPPGQNPQKFLQNTACNSSKMSQNAFLTRGSQKKWKSTIGFDEVIKHACAEWETEWEHAGVKCKAYKCVTVGCRCLKNHAKTCHFE